MRSLLNGGFEKKATVRRCFGPTQELRDYQVFCAKALAGIGKLPDTISNRCVPIQLVRRSRDEQVERFRKREAEKVARPICAELEAWSKQADNIETLGDEWLERARGALVKLCCQTEEDDGLGVNLLSAIRSAFNNAKGDKLSTQQLFETLVNQETDSPWATWWEHDLRNGKTRGPAQRLAGLLKPYKIKSRTVRLSDDTTPKGYLRGDFEEAWKRFCPSESP